jgi:RES domain-containing protein
MHPLETLIEILPTISPQSVSRTYFRAVDYDALNRNNPPNALWAGGPREEGQRFTPPGGPDCLYMSETRTTAITEMTGLFSTIEASPPIVVISIQVQLDRV